MKRAWKELEGSGWTAEEATTMDVAMKRGWTEQRGRPSGAVGDETRLDRAEET